MGLYLGNTKCKISFDDIVYCLNLFSTSPITNGIRLLSSENYILKDSDNAYLTIEESESEQL